jgi:hypothetical protein
MKRFMDFWCSTVSRHERVRGRECAVRRFASHRPVLAQFVVYFRPICIHPPILLDAYLSMWERARPSIGTVGRAMAALL